MAETQSAGYSLNTMNSYAVSDLDAEKASVHFLKHISRDFASFHKVISQGSEDGAEILLADDTCSPAVIYNIGVRLNKNVKCLSAESISREELLRCIDQAYERFTSDQLTEANDANDESYALAEMDVNDIDHAIERSAQDLLSSSGKAPIVQFVDQILFRSVQLRASDIHIQPLPEQLVVRHRIDGVLDVGQHYPLHIHKAVVSRIKVMGRMDVAERLIPQDGRCSIRIGARSIDLRISTIPTTDGERIVMRLLDSDNQLCDFSQLGMPPDIAEPFLEASRRSSGIILVTGPTGSGKTTTLYSTLRELNAPERNIMTIEDPVEYDLNGLGLPISQSQVNEKKGVNFANGLRHILRQDPDIIMVGEIRDAETARTAIQSSLTGHLVFSTLHTNDAPSAVTRLIDLGVERYLVAASLSAVLAQRLVRRSCHACTGTGLTDSKTCIVCNGNGLIGRIGIFELLVLNEGTRKSISNGDSLEAIRSTACAHGMQTLQAAGEQLIDQGLTTRAEVERVIHG